MDTMIFNIKKFPAGLHHEAKVAALKGGKTLRDWVIEAMKEKLAREETAK